MHRSLLLAVATAAALLAGCSALRPDAPPVSAGPGPAGGTCTAQPAQAATGKPATAGAVETARVRSGARMARVLRPNQAVTMEFNAERLNLVVDAAGVVTAVRCG